MASSRTMSIQFIVIGVAVRLRSACPATTGMADVDEPPDAPRLLGFVEQICLTL